MLTPRTAYFALLRRDVATLRARGLDPRRHEVHFASARFDEHLFHGTGFTRWPVSPLPVEKIEAVVASGAIRRRYGKAILKTTEEKRKEGKGAGAEGDLKLRVITFSTAPYRLIQRLFQVCSRWHSTDLLPAHA